MLFDDITPYEFYPMADDFMTRLGNEDSMKWLDIENAIISHIGTST